MNQISETKTDLEQEADYWRKKIRETRDTASEHELYLMLEALMLVEFRLSQITGSNNEQSV